MVQKLVEGEAARGKTTILSHRMVSKEHQAAQQAKRLDQHPSLVRYWRRSSIIIDMGKVTGSKSQSFR